MMMFTAAFQPSKAVFTKASSSPSSFATLSRQFSSLVLNVPAAAPSCPGGANNQQQVRSMATNRKAIDTKNAKRLKIQAKKKKNTNLAGKTGAVSTPDLVEGDGDDVTSKDQPFLQHQEWVKFQQSISVEGFQTGQSLTATVLKKSRGGKQARRKREKELLRLQQQQQQTIPGDGSSAAAMAAAAAMVGQPVATQTPTSATKFPALRYSPEETQELLRQAYEALPERAGKRGNRNLRRQNRRWKLVRDIRSQYKAHIMDAHERRMEKRHDKRQRVLHAQRDAVQQRQKDVDYQTNLLHQWVNTMYGVDLAAKDAEAKIEEPGESQNMMEP